MALVVRSRSRRSARARLALTLSALALVVSACNCGGEGELPVTEENLRGHWYGHVEVPGGGEPALGFGAAMLHLAGEIPAFPGEERAYEALGVLASRWAGSAGRYTVEGDTLLFEPAGSAGFGTYPPVEVKRLTADELVLVIEGEGTPSREVVLRRGESCLDSGLWIGHRMHLNGAAFGPDGRLHYVVPGFGYAYTHPAQCQVMFTTQADGHAIDVGPDNTVRIARMARSNDGEEQSAWGIYVRELDGDAMLEDAAAITPEVKVSDLSTTYVFPHLYLEHLGDGTPLVLYFNGNTMHAFHKPAGGEWSASEASFSINSNLTIVNPGLVHLDDGSLVVLPGGSDEGLRFDGSAWQSWHRPPPHPLYGAPTVLTVDDEGGVHGAWHVGRGVNSDPGLDTWDHLLVGRLLDDGGEGDEGSGPTWETGWAGLGKPHRLRVNEDGSYDVLFVLTRGISGPLGWAHVDASLEPAAWRASYELNQISGTEEPRTGYSSEYYVADHIRFSWGEFGDDGSLLVGGGAEAAAGGIAHLRSPRLEQQGPQPNAVLSVSVEGDVPGRVRFPSLGLECDDECELFVPDGEVFPATFHSTGFPTLELTSPVGHGTNLFSMLPDGTAALTVRTDRGGDDPHRVFLTVTFHSRYMESATLLGEAPGEQVSTPLAIASDGAGGSYALVVDGIVKLQRLDADGQVPVERALGTSGAFQVSALDGGGALVRAGLSEGLPELEQGPLTDALVRFDHELVAQSVTPVPSRNPRPVGMKLAEDGRAFEARMDYRELELTIFDEGEEPASVFVPLEALEQLEVVDGVIVITFETDNDPDPPLGDGTVGYGKRVLAGLSDQGQVLWAVEAERAQFQRLLLARAGSDLVVGVTAGPGEGWPSGLGYEALPSPEQGTLHYAFALDPHTGEVRHHATDPYFALGESLYGSEEGVVTATMDQGHLDLRALPWSGPLRSRLYSTRVGGVCVFQSCGEEPAPMASVEDGRIGVLFLQGPRPWDLDGVQLPAVPLNAVYGRWNAFGTPE